MKQPLRLQTENTFLFSASVVKLKASWDYSSHHSGLVWNLIYYKIFTFELSSLSATSIQYRSKVSYHSLARRESCLERRDSRLERRDSRLERRDFRLARRDSRLARALKNCKYGCLNFLRDFNSLL